MSTTNVDDKTTPYHQKASDTFFLSFSSLITIEVLFLSFLFFSSFNNDTQESDSSSLITKLQPHLGIKLCLQVLHRSSTGL